MSPDWSFIWARMGKMSPRLKLIGSRAVSIALSCMLLYSFARVILDDENHVLKGNSDFLDCYTAGQIVRAGEAHLLYDIPIQSSYQRRILNALNSSVTFAGGVLLYTHPPFAALLYVPFAKLTYARAFLLWNLFSLLCLFAVSYLLFRILSPRPMFSLSSRILAVLAFMPLFIVFTQGQNTFLALFFLVLYVVLVKRSKDLAAGLSLSMVLLKFQILPLFLALALIKRRWRIFLGFLAGSAFLFFLTLPVFGIDGWLQYVKLLSDMPTFVNQYGFSAASSFSMRGQIYAVLFTIQPEAAMLVTGFSAVALAWAALAAWNGPWGPTGCAFDMQVAVTVIAAILISPLINFHDLSFLLLPAVLVYHSARTQQAGALRRRLMLWSVPAVLYVLPPLQFLFRPHFPIHPVALGLLVFGLFLFMEIRATRTADTSIPLKCAGGSA